MSFASLQVSVVQLSLSAQSCVVWAQPVSGTQLSSVQKRLSSQLSGGPETQPPVLGSTVSGPLHRLPSDAQTTAVKSQVFASSLQVSVVQRLLSLQTCAV